MRTIRDEQIISQLLARDESAIEALRIKYGASAMRAAQQILGNQQDAEEVLSDALLRIWNAVPPDRPRDLAAYFYAAVRHLALNRLEKSNAAKRGGGIRPAAESAAEAVAAPEQVEQLVEQSLMLHALRQFLNTLPADARALFVLRYAAGLTVPEIARRCGCGESRVAVSLMRTRKRLKQFLKKEGWL